MSKFPVDAIGIVLDILLAIGFSSIAAFGGGAPGDTVGCRAGPVYTGEGEYQFEDVVVRMRGKREKFATDMKALERVCTVDYFTGSGSGGQHRNRHYCCVRLRHPPSGITVVATEHRSQFRNRKLAFKRIAERLREHNRDRRARIPTAVPRSVKERIRERKNRHSRKKSLRKKIRG